jgi:hypothetical protein
MSTVHDRRTTRQIIIPSWQDNPETCPVKPEITDYIPPSAGTASLRDKTRVILRLAESDDEIILPMLLRTVVGRCVNGNEHLIQLDLAPLGAHEMGVSRLHAIFYRKPNAIFLQDLDSMNGTYVNGQRLSPNQLHLLHEGDEVRFARLRCYVKLSG